jgi:hypothetical protein
MLRGVWIPTFVRMTQVRWGGAKCNDEKHSLSHFFNGERVRVRGSGIC